MAVDWMFDPASVEEELERGSVLAGAALAAARGALERADEDALSPGEHLALTDALAAVDGARRRLRAIESELLEDAQDLLQEVLDRAERTHVKLVS